MSSPVLYVLAGPNGSDKPTFARAENLAVARVAYRVADGGHTVPEDKQRYRRLWELIAQARQIAHRSRFYDNSRSAPFSPVAIYELGRPIGTPAWPVWTPAALTSGP